MLVMILKIIVMYPSTMLIVIVGGEKKCSYKHNNNIQTIYKNCGSPQNYTKCII